MMKKNKKMIGICTVLMAAILSMPLMAKNQQSTAQTDNTAETAASTADKKAEKTQDGWKLDNELKNGTYTIRIQASANDKKGYYWESYKGDKGDATLVELVTETTEEKGLAYAGSFRAAEDTKGQGDIEDTIRIVHTDGTVVDEYMEFNVKIHDGKIIEVSGGSNVLPTSDSDFASVICGTWIEEEKENMMIRLTRNSVEGFDGIVYEREGSDYKEIYTFTAKYDCILCAFLYNKGRGMFAIDPSSEGEENIKLLLHDVALTGGEDLTFIKGE